MVVVVFKRLKLSIDVSVEIAFGEAVGVVEGEIVAAVAAVVGKGDDEGLLHVGVHHRAVNEHPVFVVERDAHVAKALAEVDIHRVAAETSGDGVGIGA